MASIIPSLGKWFSGLVLLVSLMGYSEVGHAKASDRQAQTALHMLDYISVDYPEFIQDGEVLNAEEYQEQLEFAHEVLAIIEQLPANPRQSALVEQANQLLASIQNKAPGEKIAAAANRLRWDIIQSYQIEIAPQQAPDLKAAETLYQRHCATCHGAEGYGDGPTAKDLNPKPTNFHNQARQEQRSLYSLFSTITLGVSGTGMPSFQQSLSAQQRWALAFYVSNLSTTTREKNAGADLWQQGEGKALFPDLQSLATQTPREVENQYGKPARQIFAYLRSAPEHLNVEESPLKISLNRLVQSVEAYGEGHHKQAQQLAVAAYLEGFELVEARLDTVDPTLRSRIEREMMAYRKLIRQEAPEETVVAQQEQLQQLLSQAQERLQASDLSLTAITLSALAIILREGLEAVLIIAALIAFLVRSGRREAVIYVHLGWIPALVLGVVTWFAATYLISISGANRELTEGIAALLAAAILLYVGFWLHGKAYAQRWKTFIAEKVKGALNKRTLGALALLSFLAVYREVFETVLFYQALWTQASSKGHLAILGGFATGAVILIVLSWLIFRYSTRLPLKLFFGTTSVLLALLAVVLAGKGIGALQEAGLIPVDPVAFPSVPALGIYPSWQVLILQAILLILIIGGFAYTYAFSRRPSAASS